MTTDSLYQRLNGKTILITGATGFVGGRLVELLAEHTTAEIKVLVRDYGKAMRLGRYAVTLIKGNVNDESVVKEAVSGCDYVLHCAYGNKGSAEARHKVNVEGTSSLLKFSKEAGVRGFVFLSTVSVYGLPAEAYLTETSPAHPLTGDDYAISKLQAEQGVLDFARQQSFHATVLQPTAVYGPWSPSYVLRPIASLKQHKYPLINGGNGVCNAVYVDDLCQAIFLAALTPKASGQKYLINGPTYFSWKEFYTALASCVAGAELESISAEAMNQKYRLASKRKPLYKIVPRLLSLNKNAVRELLQYKFFSDLAGFALKHLPAVVLQKIRPASSSNSSTSIVKKMMLLDPDSTRFFTSTTKVDAHKAMEELGYEPTFDQEKSFEKIKQWSAWYFHTPA